VAPDGTTFERDIVHHPGAVAVVPVLGDELVLVRQYRAPIDAELLELPAGIRDVAGEPGAETARRELLEETGYRAGTVEPLIRYVCSAGFSDEEMEIFLATDLVEDTRTSHGVEEEHMTVERVRLDDALDLIEPRRAARRQDHRRRAPRSAPPGAVTAPVAGDDLAGRDELPLEVTDFLTWLVAGRGRAANTCAAYERDLRAWCRWLGERDRTVTTAVEADLVAYIADLRAGGRAPASVARAAAALRSFHRFLLDEGLAGADPAAAVDAPSVPAGLPKALSEEEVLALLDQITGPGPAVVRDRAIVEILYGTGARISEVVGLDLARWTSTARSCACWARAGASAVVPLGRCALDALAAWLGAGGRGAMVPARWARRTDAEAVFLNQRGGRLSRPGGVGDRPGVRRARPTAGSAQPARAAPLVRHAHARPRCRHPLGAGAARACLDLDDPGLHAGVERTTPSGVPPEPPAGPALKRTAGARSLTR
jgi:integrase/recombinase XerD